MSSIADVPAFTGYVETTVHALRLIYAAKQGLVPRITRRLNDAERRTMIRSGAVFIFSVEESGIKRWTDGLLWSPSRIVGNFLVYREINERNSSRTSHHRKPYPTEESPARAMIRKSSPEQLPMNFKNPGNDQGTFKSGGLVKKTITITFEGSDIHLVSYYTPEDIRSGRLRRPSCRPDIMSLYLPPELFSLSNLRVPPKFEVGPDGRTKFLESEEVESIHCKTEDTGYSLPSSPNWSNQGSPNSVDNMDPTYSNGTMYTFGGSQSGGSYGKNNNQHGRWASMGGDMVSSIAQNDVSWSPSASTLTASHTMGRRRDGSIQQDTWPSIQSQSAGRGWTQDTSATSPTSVYQGRSRMVRPSQAYDGATAASSRRDPDSNNFPLRYTPHPNTTREDALQRLHWQSNSREGDSSREHRRSGSTASHSYSSYQGTPATYGSSWTPQNPNIMTTPTLHSVSSSQELGYEGTYTFPKEEYTD